MAYIFQMESKDGEKLYPICHSKGVLDENGKCIEDNLKENETAISNAEKVAISNLNSKVTDAKKEIDKSIEDANTELKQSFQDGVNTIYNYIVERGVTPNSKSLQDILTSLENLKSYKYNFGHEEKILISAYITAQTGFATATVHIHGALIEGDTSNKMQAYSAPSSGEASETKRFKVTFSGNNEIITEI